MAESDDVLDTCPQPDAQAVNDESLVEAQAAVQQLDDAAREVLELHLHASLTFHEIAQLLDQPLPTVASRYRRAIERIRKLMEICHE
jgi:RNA polymerase sigma-70 factor (ECF subfamily)